MISRPLSDDDGVASVFGGSESKLSVSGKAQAGIRIEVLALDRFTCFTVSYRDPGISQNGVGIDLDGLIFF